MLVVADPHTQSGKARKAREVGTRIVGESAYLQMLAALESRDTAKPPAAPAQRQPEPSEEKFA